MNDLRGLTLWQPHASLVAMRLKWIETRSWSTSYRGPLAIHAGKHVEWCRVGDYAVLRDGDVPDRFPSALALHQGDDVYQAVCELPLGAVVATCTLVDVVPIVGMCEEGAVRRVEVGTMGGEPNLMLCAPHPDGEPGVDFDGSDYYEHDITDQLPYGDFSPGRYAWLFEGIKALPEPIPCRGRQGLWRVPSEVVERLGVAA